ncbi:MAG: ABC transporter substrate-binding protein [Ruminiclostridium sp.]
MKSRKLKSLLLASALLITASSCGYSGRTADSGTTAAASTTENIANVIREEAPVVEIDENQETGTIKLLIYYDLVKESADLVDKFETKYNGSIEQELCSSGSAYFEKLATLVAADLSPDIVRYEWMSFPHGISRNMYTPLDSYIDLDSELWSGIKEIAEQYKYNGKHYYIPYSITSSFALNYNKTVLQEYGLEDPIELYKRGEWDWNTFKELLTKWCDANPDHIGYTGVGGMSFIATTGMELIDVQNDKIINNMKDENIQRCMEMLEELAKHGLTGEGYVDPAEAFVDGKLLFLGMEPTWTYGSASQSLFKNNVEYQMAFLPFPRDPASDKYNIAYDSFGYMVPSGAKNVKGAIDWITLNRINVTDPDTIAKDRAKALDSSTKYYPKCAECKYSFAANETEDLTACPECGTARKVKFNAYYTEEQYDILMDMTTPENQKFSFVFDNCNGFSTDVTNLLNGSEGLLDAPLYAGASYTQLREEYYLPMEMLLDDYRNKLAAEN